MGGLFISFEGIDGAGKSTHIDALAQAFRAQGRAVTLTREPGGTPLAEKLRSIVLNDAMDPMTEALLVFAARRDHLQQVIEPALARGEVVLCDRFTDATFAYQGGGHGFDLEMLSILEQWVQTSRGLAACRTYGVDSGNRPQREQFLPDLQAHSPAMGQKDGVLEERRSQKWTAAVDSQPTFHKSDRLPEVNSTIFIRQPDMTVWFDVPPETAAERLSGTRVPDKFESQPLEFFRRVAQAYARRAAQSPERFVRIDASVARHKVWQQITSAMVRRGWLAIMVAANGGPK